jgi:hypothetical protein
MATVTGTVCAACNGGRAHHTVAGDACWCPTCLKLPEPDRCQAWSPKQIELKTSRRRVKAKQQLDRSLPKSGSLRRTAYDFIDKAALAGLTDDELAYKLGRRLEQAAATRGDLLDAGLIELAGHERAGAVGMMPAWRLKR